jgi:hypothetical protein
VVVRRDFRTSKTSKQAPRPTPSYARFTEGSFLGGSDWGVCLTTCLHLASMLKLSGALPMFPLYAFLVWVGTCLPLSVYAATGLLCLRKSCLFWCLAVKRGVLPAQFRGLQPFNAGIKSLRATLPDDIFYWGF